MAIDLMVGCSENSRPATRAEQCIISKREQKRAGSTEALALLQWQDPLRFHQQLRRRARQSATPVGEI